MPQSSQQLEQAKNEWSKKVTAKIGGFEQGDAKTVTMHIEAEKVGVLYEIAMQLALAREMTGPPPRR
jgi:hypothetical protein